MRVLLNPLTQTNPYLGKKQPYQGSLRPYLQASENVCIMNIPVIQDKSRPKQTTLAEKDIFYGLVYPPRTQRQYLNPVSIPDFL